MKLRTLTSMAVTGACLLATALIWAGEQGGDDASTQAGTEHEESMAAWQKAAMPGEPHAWLMAQAGTWDVKQKLWMKPGGEPQVMKGTAKREAILGGRVLKETYASTFMGKPFNGVAHSGYDNVTGTYWTTWFDNMGTALYTGEGECNDDHSRCTYVMTGSNAMTGGQHEMRIEITHGDGTETHVFHEERDGEMMKTMETVYTRTATEG